MPADQPRETRARRQLSQLYRKVAAADEIADLEPGDTDWNGPGAAPAAMDSAATTPPSPTAVADAPAELPPLTPARLLPRLRPTSARPTVGWQGRVHAWTGGRWSPRPSATEQQHRALVTAVQAPFTGPRLVAVVNPKGGARKTPAVLATAATWGAHRGSVIALDDNETRVTLAMRALADSREPTVRGLLAGLPDLETAHARIGDVAAHIRPQGDTRFDVLASDDDPARMAQFGADEFTRVRDVLARFYAPIAVVDTGNNVRAGNWQAAVDAADQLLLASTYQRDSAVTASWTLDHLRDRPRPARRPGRHVLSVATPTTDRRVRGQLRDHFTARTRAVVEIPFTTPSSPTGNTSTSPPYA